MLVASLIATTRTGDLAALARRTETIRASTRSGFSEHIVLPSGSLSPFPFAPSWPEHYGRWVDPFVALTVAATATHVRLKLAAGVPASCPSATLW